MELSLLSVYCKPPPIKIHELLRTFVKYFLGGGEWGVSGDFLGGCLIAVQLTSCVVDGRLFADLIEELLHFQGPHA